jgi:outer membrane protein assembly factor BamB
VSTSTKANSSEELSRDLFGFRQIIVAATSHGKVYGIDSSNGEIIWSRILGLGWAEGVGAEMMPVKIYVTKSVSDGGDPEVVLVVQRRADNVRPLVLRRMFSIE